MLLPAPLLLFSEGSSSSINETIHENLRAGDSHGAVVMHPTLTAGYVPYHHHHTLTHDDKKVKLRLEENSFFLVAHSLSCLKAKLAIYQSLTTIITTFTSYSAATVSCRNHPTPILQLFLLLPDAKEGSFSIAAATLAVVRSRCCAAEVAVYVVSLHLLLSTGLG